jgi:hypothetical protein
VELVLVLALSAHLAVAAQAEGSKPLAHLEAAKRVLDGMSPAALGADVRDAIDDAQPPLWASRTRQPLAGWPSLRLPAASCVDSP